MASPIPRCDPVAFARARGPIVTRQQLLAAGCTVRQIAAAVHRGALIRIRRAWYAVPDAPLDARIAVMLGARLGSLSAAKHYGLWTGFDDRIHASWDAHGNVAKPGRELPYPGPLEVDGHEVVPYWTVLRDTLAAPSADAPWRESIEQSLAQILIRADRATAVACADSALHQGVIDASDFRFVAGQLPLAARELASLVDGRADSGLESIVRLGLHDLGVPFLVHPWIEGVGEVDLLVGDSLIVETDGAATHATNRGFFEDRRRDNASALRGYITARFSSRLVLHDWPACAAQLAAHVWRGDHVRPVSGLVIPG